MPWVIILAFALHPEKKAIDFGLCSCEGKGGTRDILRFPFALGTNVLRFPLSLTTPCYKGPLLCPLPKALLWTLTSDEIARSWFPTLPLLLPSQSFPSAHLLRGTFGLQPRRLLPCSGRCCRNWAGSRKWQLSVHETHAQLLREQKLYNLMLLPCRSGPCRGWWQNTQRRPQTEGSKGLIASATWAHDAWCWRPGRPESGLWGTACVSRLGGGSGGVGDGGPLRVGSCTNTLGSSSQRKWRGAAWGTLAVYRNCCPFLAREVSACGGLRLWLGGSVWKPWRF